MFEHVNDFLQHFFCCLGTCRYRFPGNATISKTNNPRSIISIIRRFEANITVQNVDQWSVLKITIVMNCFDELHRLAHLLLLPLPHHGLDPFQVMFFLAESLQSNANCKYWRTPQWNIRSGLSVLLTNPIAIGTIALTSHHSFVIFQSPAIAFLQKEKSTASWNRALDVSEEGDMSSSISAVPACSHDSRMSKTLDADFHSAHSLAVYFTCLVPLVVSARFCSQYFVHSTQSAAAAYEKK